MKDSLNKPTLSEILQNFLGYLFQSFNVFPHFPFRTPFAAPTQIIHFNGVIDHLSKVRVTRVPYMIIIVV